MIKYSLCCDNGHEFEAWFGSSSDYDEQRKRGFVDCPVCGSTQVEKMLMAPGVAGTKKSADADVPMAQVPPVGMPNIPKELAEQFRALKKHVQEHSEDVGTRFPEEARKIHYGEAEARGIYGTATPEEASSLVEEGVEVLPIPELPEDKN